MKPDVNIFVSDFMTQIQGVAMAPRHYSSPTREKTKRRTREAILEALVRVVVDEGVHAFSVGNVAQRAGVSERTVYRHFASREELLEGLAESIDTGPPEQDPGTSVVALAESPSKVDLFFEVLEDRREFAIAETVASAALGHVPRGKHSRWAAMQAEVQSRFPELHPDEQLAGAAAMRALGSTNAWFHLCVQLGIPAGAAAKGIARALELVLQDLEQTNNERRSTDG